MLKARITEKSMAQAEGLGEYSFIIPGSFTKTQTRQLVEKTFGVKVARVRTKNLKGKIRRFGKKRNNVQLGNRKLAIVKLKGKDRIDLFDVKDSKNA